MKKVLVTDLFGTLVPDLCYCQMLYYYGNGFERSAQDDQFLDKVLKKGLLNLKKFLDDGNTVYLVTSINDHEDPSIMLTRLINRFYENVKDYKDNVHIFLSGAHNLYNIEDIKSVSTQIGHNHYAFNNFDFYRISKKEEVFDFVLNNHRLYQELLFSIGDSAADLPMLCRCIHLGGRSSLIDNSLYRLEDEANIDHLIAEMVYESISVDYEHLNENEEDRTKIIKEFDRLYEKLRNGSLDYDRLLKYSKIKRLVDDYNCEAHYSFSNRKVIEVPMVKKLTMYPTFNDYSNRVLNK